MIRVTDASLCHIDAIEEMEKVRRFTTCGIGVVVRPVVNHLCASSLVPYRLA